MAASTDPGSHRSAPLGIIAGGGAVPRVLAESAVAQGRGVFIVALEGAADDWVTDYPHGWSALGTVGKTLKLLREAGCRDVVMIGRVMRPDFKSLKLDWQGTKLLPRVVAAARGGDDQLLRALVSIFEEKGFHVLGADHVTASLTLGAGAAGAVEPHADALDDIAAARRVLTALSPFDVGQGAVVARGYVLAIEAAEGTDAMLERCMVLDAHLRGTDGARAGVLVKLPKTAQDRRVDLPTIGVRTVERAAAAGLAGIAVEAGGALVVDKGEVIAAADRLGLFVLGLDPQADAAS